jgi:hypothetical protein
MTGYLGISSVLDKLYFQVIKKELLSPTKGSRILGQVLDRIGEKERSSPIG